MGSTVPALDGIRHALTARLPEVIRDLRAKSTGHTSQPREAGYTIQNADGDEAVVRIYDEIWEFGINARDLVADLDAVTAAQIRVEINSPGGNVFDGIAIYNALRNHPATVTTRVDGIAASIASIIAQAGDRRIMQPAGQMMIHNAWGVTVGDTKDHADMSKLLDQQDAVLAGIYAARSGRPVDEFRALMNAETWLTADAAVAAGLADEVVDTAAKNTVRPTLHAQIADTVEAVKRVDALRAQAGKGLSNTNRESLVGLRDELTALLDGEPEANNDAPVPPEVLDLQARLYARQTGRPIRTGV